MKKKPFSLGICWLIKLPTPKKFIAVRITENMLFGNVQNHMTLVISCFFHGTRSKMKKQCEFQMRKNELAWVFCHQRGHFMI